MYIKRVIKFNVSVRKSAGFVGQVVLANNLCQCHANFIWCVSKHVHTLTLLKYIYIYLTSETYLLNT